MTNCGDETRIRLRPRREAVIPVGSLGHEALRRRIVEFQSQRPNLLRSLAPVRVVRVETPHQQVTQTDRTLFLAPITREGAAVEPPYAWPHAPYTGKYHVPRIARATMSSRVAARDE
jgi:hypothetical protein